MRIIISGGTGSIGLPFAQMMQARGDEVIILSRNPARYHLPDGLRVVQWDGRTGEGWSQFIHDDTALVNLAGENPAANRWTNSHKAHVLQSRLSAANAMLDAVQKADVIPHTLLQASAVGWYGNKGANILTEDAPQAGDNWRAQVCVDWEVAIQPIKERGVRLAILRIGIVLERGGGALPSFVWAGRFFGRRLGAGNQYIPWVHNDDVALQMQFLLDNTHLEGIFNLVAPEPATNAQFLQTLTRILGRVPLFPVPAWALKLALGEMATTVLDSQRVVPQRLIEAGYTFKYPDLDDALRALVG
jgi:uncharacterized protein (TIGR01777 family)